jgi:tetrahydromethanopterin S-methyltransferase subunit B
MKKYQIFLLIVALGVIGRYILYPMVVFLFKMTVGLVLGLGAIALIALIVYVAHETAKHN